jgi:hypothetical protein
MTEFVIDTNMSVIHMVSNTDILMTQMLGNIDTLVTKWLFIETYQCYKWLVTQNVSDTNFCEELYTVREKGVRTEFCKM